MTSRPRYVTRYISMSLGLWIRCSRSRWNRRSLRWQHSSRAAIMSTTVEKSDHFDEKRFVNPTGTAGQPFTAVPRMLLERRTPWPRRVDAPPRQPPELDGAAAVVMNPEEAVQAHLDLE